ncbi:MAG: VOC family protein [Thermomicrobiales bacterium]
MSSSDQFPTGTFQWMDLTVPDAAPICEFYAAVAGWRPEPVAMGGYDDYLMMAPGGDEAVAGVCYARGANADLPALWLPYVAVADLDISLRECRERGGKVLTEIKGGDDGARYGVIQDPAGAVIALIQLGAE